MPLGIVNDSEFELERQNSDVELVKQQNGIHINPNGGNKSVSESEPELNESINNEIENVDNIQPRTSLQPVIIEMPRVGRLPEATNIPISLRKVLAETVAIEGLSAGQELANALGGLSQPSLSTYARGESSPGKVNEDLTEYLNGRKTKIAKRALNKINLAIMKMESEKFDELGPLELAGVAERMSNVVQKMEPKSKEKEVKDPVQFHIFAPQVRNENHYETVVAKDNY